MKWKCHQMRDGAAKGQYLRALKEGDNCGYDEVEAGN
jgi:hypothetical protein